MRLRRKPIRLRPRRPHETDDTERLQQALNLAGARRWRRVVEIEAGVHVTPGIVAEPGVIIRKQRP